jgi:hypothetical protein
VYTPNSLQGNRFHPFDKEKSFYGAAYSIEDGRTHHDPQHKSSNSIRIKMLFKCEDVIIRKYQFCNLKIILLPLPLAILQGLPKVRAWKI